MSIELPKDAEGREIPLDTEVLYTCDGSKYKVAKWEFYPNKDTSWLVCLDANTEVFRVPGYMYLTPSDSWEKLLEDLDNAVKGGDNAECCYMRREGIEVGTQCHGCRLYERGEDNFTECSYLAYADIAARIRKLRGED